MGSWTCLAGYAFIATLLPALVILACRPDWWSLMNRDTPSGAQSRGRTALHGPLLQLEQEQSEKRPVSELKGARHAGDTTPQYEIIQPKCDLAPSSSLQPVRTHRWQQCFTRLAQGFQRR